MPATRDALVTEQGTTDRVRGRPPAASRGGIPTSNAGMARLARDGGAARANLVGTGGNQLARSTLAVSHPNDPAEREAEAVAIAEKLLAKVDLADKREAYPARLSGGQQQRVAIARALAMAPKVLLFDEATSALDPELRREVLLVMRQLALEGMTMLVVTHEMNFARHVGTRTVFMDRGEIVEEAPGSAFFDAPRTERARRFLQQFED